MFVAAVSDDHRRRLHEALDVDGDHLAEELATRSAIDAFKVLDDAGVPVEIVDEAFCRDLFDEDFVSYHEDADWGFRAQLVGLTCWYTPTARA